MSELFKITPGAVIVNDGGIVREADGILCLSFDLATKYAELSAIGGDDGCPVVYLAAGPDTLRVSPDHDRDSFTIITFTGHKGWDVFATSGPARYTLNVVLLRREPQG